MGTKKNLNHFFFSRVRKQFTAKDFLINFMYLKTGGNPLTVIQFIKNNINQGFVRINNGVASLTKYFITIVNLEDMLTVDAPLCRVQIDVPIFDKLSCLESLIMKVASVIGDIFDFVTLLKVHPFKDQITTEKLYKLLVDLEQNDFLEVLDQTNSNIF